MTSKPRKSWQEKLADDKDLPKVLRLTGKAKAKWGAGTMVIPVPREVDAVMRGVPRGKLITINEIRTTLAKKHAATVGCPITTGIFAWIAAHAAEEASSTGQKRVTSYCPLSPWERVRVRVYSAIGVSFKPSRNKNQETSFQNPQCLHCQTHDPHPSPLPRGEGVMPGEPKNPAASSTPSIPAACKG